MSQLATISRGWRVITMFSGLVLAGCAPAYGPAGVEFVARRPPRELIDVRVVAPGPRYVWIAGHYAWQRGDFAWVSGRWELPPQAEFRRWDPGRWVQARQGWYWAEGRWR
jgi:hypothetical protein